MAINKDQKKKKTVWNDINTAREERKPAAGFRKLIHLDRITT